MLEKKDILKLLEDKKIDCVITEHAPVYTIEEMREQKVPDFETIAKNLFVRDDKKRNYYLISVREEKRVDLKEFQANHGTRRLSFASEEDLQRLTGLSRGSVTPFGLLNDAEHIVHFYLDRSFADDVISVHPNENTATVKLATSDLLAILREAGVDIQLADFV